MKSIFLTILVSLASATALFAQSDINTVPIGTTLSNQELVMQNANGTATSLSRAMGKNGIVLIFSCNTCPFVIGSDSFGGWEKTYNSVAEEAQKLGFAVVLINSNEAKRTGDDSIDKMKERAKEKGYTMPYLVDENSTLANALGAKTTPHVFAFDKNNVLIYSGMIDNSVDSKRKEEIPYLMNALTETNSGKTITTTSTPPRGCSIKRK